MLDRNPTPSNQAGDETQSRLRSFVGQLSSVAVVLIVLGLLLAALMIWRGARLGGEQGRPQIALPVAATVVEPREVPVTLDAVGNLRAVEEVMLAPEVGGRVVEINFQAGDSIEEGALLVQLFDGPERADLAAAKAALKLAETQLERSQRLATSGANSEERLDQREAEREQAEAVVAELEAHIRQKQVRAPFTGEIGIRQINLGQYLNAGETVATLTALDKLFVEFSLPQQDFSLLKRGATVSVTSDTWPERKFVAEVNAIEPQISEDTRNVLVQAILNNQDGALRPGMYVTASLFLPPEKNALVVPVTAIMTSAQGNSILVIRGDNAREGGTAEIVPVVSGRRIGENVVVTRGLVAGDVVVTEGQLRVQPGASVKVAKLTPVREE